MRPAFPDTEYDVADATLQLDIFFARLADNPTLGRIFDRETAAILLRQFNLSLPATAKCDRRLIEFRLRQFHKDMLVRFDFDRATGLRYIDVLMGTLEDCGVDMESRRLLHAQLLALLPSGAKLAAKVMQPFGVSRPRSFSFVAAALECQQVA